MAKKKTNSSMEFTFGDAEPINGNLIDFLKPTFDSFNGTYTPPIEFAGLAKIGNANATHGRCINFKVNQMAMVLVDTGLVSLRDFGRAAKDLETFGNAYFQRINNAFGHLLYLEHIPTLNMRNMKNGRFKYLSRKAFGEHVEFDAHEVLHAFHYDPEQNIYGLPQWIGALQSALLNSEATLFRRRYYLNGSHMGYILYTSDPTMDKDVENEIRKRIEDGKGVGNFRSMFINIPNGKEKAVQIIPVGDISQKDEFDRVKNISADDIIIGHGVQASLVGVKPNNTGGFGDIEKIESFYRRNEVPALVRPFLELNDQLPANKQFNFDFDANAIKKDDAKDAT